MSTWPKVSFLASILVSLHIHSIIWFGVYGRELEQTIFSFWTPCSTPKPSLTIFAGLSFWCSIEWAPYRKLSFWTYLPVSWQVGSSQSAYTFRHIRMPIWEGAGGNYFEILNPFLNSKIPLNYIRWTQFSKLYRMCTLSKVWNFKPLSRQSWLNQPRNQ